MLHPSISGKVATLQCELSDERSESSSRQSWSLGSDGTVLEIYDHCRLWSPWPVGQNNSQMRQSHQQLVKRKEKNLSFSQQKTEDDNRHPLRFPVEARDAQL